MVAAAIFFFGLIFLFPDDVFCEYCSILILHLIDDGENLLFWFIDCYANQTKLN